MRLTMSAPRKVSAMSDPLLLARRAAEATGADCDSPGCLRQPSSRHTAVAGELADPGARRGRPIGPRADARGTAPRGNARSRVAVIADMLTLDMWSRTMKWQIGDVTVTKIVELETTGGSRFILPQATREAVLPISWLIPHFADEEGRLKMSIHALIVEAPGRRIIVDTCLGNDKKDRRIPTWNDRQGRFLAGSGRGRLSPARRSIPCCARTCTSITSAGTPCWSTAGGCRPSRRRATCSAASSTSTGARRPSAPTCSPSLPTAFARSSSAASPISSSGTTRSAPRSG